MAVEVLSQNTRRAAAGLRTSAYDRSASLLIALLVTVGAAVLGVVILFLSSRVERTPPAIPFTPVAASDSLDDVEGDLSEDLPGLEDAPEEAIEDLEEVLDQLALSATDDSLQLTEEGATENANARRGDPRAKGGRRGRGRRREPRWEVHFEPQSVKQYSEWLDRAGLELGVLGLDNVVYYATGLSQPQPTVRSGAPADEKRLYFNSTGGPLHPLDRQLAKKAGIGDRGPIVLQFCQPATQEKLLALEAAASGGRPRTEVARTVFGVVAGPGGSFEFEVKEQQFNR